MKCGKRAHSGAMSLRNKCDGVQKVTVIKSVTFNCKMFTVDHVLLTCSILSKHLRSLACLMWGRKQHILCTWCSQNDTPIPGIYKLNNEIKYKHTSALRILPFPCIKNKTYCNIRCCKLKQWLQDAHLSHIVSQTRAIAWEKKELTIRNKFGWVGGTLAC